MGAIKASSPIDLKPQNFCLRIVPIETNYFNAHFLVSVPMDLDVKVKATLLGAVFLIVSVSL